MGESVGPPLSATRASYSALWTLAIHLFKNARRCAISSTACAGDPSPLVPEPSSPEAPVPRATRFTDSLDSHIPAIARRLRNRMRLLSLNDQALADECNRRAREVIRGTERLRMSRERIAKILMNCKKNPERTSAKVISYTELKALSAALSVSIEWLVGQQDNQDPVHWNVMVEPKRAEHLLHLLSEYEEKAGELLAWAEFLMCSLVTPELMHAQHRARFEELKLVGLDAEREAAVALFDRIGDTRRQRLLRSKDERGYGYRQIIFYSGLKVMADGESEYRLAGVDVRRECLKYLAGLVGDGALGIEIIVVDDEGARPLKPLLRDYDSLSVFGSEFTLWGYHSGSVAWSEHGSYIELHRKILGELQARAITHTPREVVELLNDLSQQAR